MTRLTAVCDLTPHQKAQFQTIDYDDAGVPVGIQPLGGRHSVLSDAALRVPFGRLLMQKMQQNDERILPFLYFSKKEFNFFFECLESYIGLETVSQENVLNKHLVTLKHILNKKNNFMSQEFSAYAGLAYSDRSVAELMGFMESNTYRHNKQLYSLSKELCFRTNTQSRNLRLMARLSDEQIVCLPLPIDGTMPERRYKTLVAEIANMNEALTRVAGMPEQSPVKVVAVGFMYVNDRDYVVALGGYSYGSQVGNANFLPKGSGRTATAALCRRAAKIAERQHRAAILNQLADDRAAANVGCGGCVVS
jgi:hypothetical protein